MAAGCMEEGSATRNFSLEFIIGPLRRIPLIASILQVMAAKAASARLRVVKKAARYKANKKDKKESTIASSMHDRSFLVNPDCCGTWREQFNESMEIIAREQEKIHDLMMMVNDEHLLENAARPHLAIDNAARPHLTTTPSALG
ncbi:hypothetical protein CYMTET_49329 [Cymbomonas tetramitiformis]|uniref:Uncharacterized protein n=1 Tax=Cymbomonas tetramitiformis TaxID=36881 RepID=A0AAE0EU03_9CHLO|nr:hypothetical protein CYMTET_49329 [Cymbomonas tetramitiformis]